MAPISSLSSLSTSSSTMNRCHCGASADNLLNFYLPISRRGLFLQDSFFEHAHALFNDAVRQVLGRWSGSESLMTDSWNDTNLCLSNNLSRYRQLRAQNLKEENQAVTARDDNASHKIVLDVHDFMDGEVKVKVVGERELVVEGHTKTNTGDYSVSSQSFRRHFTLPDLTNIETITSVMSSDGILTITAPKIVNHENKEYLTIPITVEGTTSTNQAENNAASSQTTSSTSTSSTNGKLSDTTEECRCKASCQEYEAVSSSVRQQNRRKVPIKINSTVIGSECDSQTSESKHTCIHSNGSITNSKLGAETETEKLLAKKADESFIKTTDKKTENLTNSAQMHNASNVSTNASVASDAQHSTVKQVHTNSKLQTQDSTTSSKVNMGRDIPISNCSFLPITRRGLFSSDSFFEDIRKDFENTVNETLRKWGETGLLTDRWGDASLRLSNNLGRYRQLRIHNLREEDQAVTVTSDNASHKIVLDVHDFMDGEVKVKVVGERELVVEGHTKTNTGDYSVSSQSFRRHFTLPDLTNIETITSVMSSDGILTITASKKVNQATAEGYIIPIMVDGRSNTDVKTSSTSTSQAASGNTASTTNSKRLEAEEKTCTADERQEKMQQQNVTKSTLHEKRTESKTEDKTTWNNVNDSQKKFTQQSHEHVTSQEHSKKGKTIPIQTETEASPAAEPLTATPQETRTPSHQSTTSSSEKSTLTSQSGTSEDKHSVTESSDVHSLRNTILPVTTRGHFFSDSFFRNSWKDFQDAVQDVVSKWSDRSSATDDMTFYRSLRDRDIKEEYQAAKSSEDDVNIKIVVDVRNFTNGGEITVKAVRERELVVEGRVQKEEDGSSFTKRFLRHFVLPCDVCLESVTSVLSSDGVLTITAPKKPSNLRIKEVIVPTAVEEGTHKTEKVNLTSEQTSRLNTETQTSAVSPAVPVKTEGSSESSAQASVREESSSRHNSSVTSQKVSDVREHIIPLQLDETQESQTSAQENISTKNTKPKNSLRKDDFWIKQTVQEENEMKDCTTDDKTGVDLEDISQVTTLGSQSMTNESTNKKVYCMTQHDQTELENVGHVSQEKWLPITVRGTFFNDSFFEDSRSNFAAAVRDVLKTKEGSSLSDDITSYRSLRERDLKLENQAVHVEEDQQSLKIVIDVYDFIEGEVNVSVDGGKELVIEGQAKIKEGTTRTFLRRFSLPRFVDLDAITSTMSSDGVLTIISPKLQQGSPSGTSEKEVFTESQARIDTQSDAGRAWAEKCEKKSAKDSEGCSSRTFSSTYRSLQEYSSKKSF
ncbi:uncharacterized protein [Panulirus ornatus]|uniref:uncharacterized protein n=1 Tax=Panulirus ornatus TaxID=150431 RepID=UPI003A8400FA